MIIIIMLTVSVAGTFDVQNVVITDNSSSGEVCFECLFIPGDTISGCRIEYTSRETNFSGNFTIANTEHCRELYAGIDNDNTDDDTITTELITSEYVIRAYDIDYTDVAAVESVANITVTNTTRLPATGDPPTKASNATTNNTTTTDTPSECGIFPCTNVVIIVSFNRQ